MAKAYYYEIEAKMSKMCLLCTIGSINQQKLIEY